MTTPTGPESRRHPDEQELARAVHASDALRQLLAAAAAPPSTAELKGRSRAVAAFRAAYRLRRPGAGTPPAGSGTPADQLRADQLRVDQVSADPVGADPQSPTEIPADGRAADDGGTPAGSRRRTKLARARRWSAAQFTVAGASLLMLLGTTTAVAG